MLVFLVVTDNMRGDGWELPEKIFDSREKAEAFVKAYSGPPSQFHTGKYTIFEMLVE